MKCNLKPLGEMRNQFNLVCSLGSEGGNELRTGETVFMRGNESERESKVDGQRFLDFSPEFWENS
jgi:outer membrane receptor for monomeric catechols